MTRISVIERLWLSWVGQPARRSIFQLALLASLVLVTGCEGSQLGNALGDRLEPDPQLADNPNGLAESADAEPPKDTLSDPKAEENKPSAAASADDNPEETATKPEDTPKADAAPPKVTAGGYNDLGKAPEEIQEYMVDLLELDVLEVRAPVAPPAPASSNETSDDEEGEDTASEDSAESTPAPVVNAPGPGEFRPNQAITRREYARWLLAVNNLFYQGERDRKIRTGVSSSQPVFTDVSVSDPDFAAIQGLAEAGIIPSPLTGSSTTVTFRPNAPLTRQDMLLWKVPLDTRQTLPDASISAVELAWGFQDAERIDPRALQAVLADHQNGDFANIRRAYSYTTLFQPSKAATRAEALAVLWRFGNPAEGITAAEIRSNRPTND